MNDTYLYTEDTDSRIKTGAINLNDANNYKYIFNIYRMNQTTDKFKLWVNNQGIASFDNTAKGGFNINANTSAAEYILIPVDGQDNVYMLRGYADNKAYLKIVGDEVQVCQGDQTGETAMWVKIHKTTVKSSDLSSLNIDYTKNYYLRESSSGLYVNNLNHKTQLTNDINNAKPFKIALDETTGCHTFIRVDDDQVDQYFYAGWWDAEISPSKCVWSIEDIDANTKSFKLHFTDNLGDTYRQTGFLGAPNKTDGQALFSNQTHDDGNADRMLRFEFVEGYVTYNYVKDEKIVATKNIGVQVGQDFPTQTLPDYVQCTFPSGTISNENIGQVFEIPVEYKLPFEISENFANATWYYMNIRSNGKKWVSINENGNLPYKQDGERKFEANAQWAFTGDPFNGIQLLNKAAGDGYTLGYGETNTNSNIYMEAENTNWEVQTGNGGFVLHISGNKYLHDMADKLQVWDDGSAKNDPGSALNVELVEPENYFYQTWGNFYPWTNEDVTELPNGMSLCKYGEEGLEHKVRKAETKINAKGGNLEVVFTYTGGTQMVMIIGVDLVKDGEIKYQDYHEGKAGSSPEGTTYVITDIEAGEYTLRYYVCEMKSGENTHRLNDTRGIIKVTGATRSDFSVVYNFTIGGVTRESQTSSAGHSDHYPEITVEFPWGIRATKPNGTIKESDIVNGYVSKDIEMEEILPFYKTTSFEDATWYLLDMHHKEEVDGIFSGEMKYVMTYVPDAETHNVQLPKEYSKQTETFGDEKLWCFIGNAYDGFKIYNKLAGQTMTLNKNTEGNNNATMSSADDATLYRIEASTAYEGSFCFKPVGHTYYLNAQTNEELGVKVLKGWYDPDGGSSCRVFMPTDFVKECILSEYNEKIPACAIGTKKTLNKKNYYLLATTLFEINKDGWNTDAVTSEVSDVLQTLQTEEELFTFQPNTYYRLISAATKEARGSNITAYVNRSNNNVLWKEGTDMNSVDNIWKFVPTTEEGKYYLQAANGGYAQAPKGGSARMYLETNEANAGKYEVLAYDGHPTHHRIRTNTGPASHFWADGNNIICGWENGWNGNAAWYIAQATDIEITIGSAEYSTVYLPFDVTLPEEGVSAFAINSTTDTSAKLTEKEDIPANTGAILYGQGTHTLNISTASSNWEGNMLSGTNVNAYIDGTAGSAYVLSMPTIDGVAQPVGLYKATLNKNANGEEGTTHFKNNANKAYLLVTGSNSRFFVFDFGGNETGIESVEGENGNANSEVYDLAGRRVQNAKKGIFVINGKVVVK